MSTANLVVRFLCEVAAVGALVWWGWPFVGIALGLAVILFWGTFVAPKAPHRLLDPLRLVCELVIFAGATAGLVAVGQVASAVVFGVAAAGSALLVRCWPEPTPDA